MKKNMVSFLLCFCIAASLLSGMTPSAFAESLPLEAREACAAVVNDMPVAYQSRGGTEPQRDRGMPKATDEGESIPAVEDVSLVSSVGEDGKTIDVLRETSPALRAPSPVGRADELLPIETAPAEEVTAELQATYSGTCGEDLTWTLDTDTGLLTISGTGAMRDWNTAAPWVHYRDSIKTVTIESGVTSIGNDAFSSCDSLTSVTISNSVTTIGDDAFACCTSLTSVTIPNSVTSIGMGAFSSCSSLTSVHITDLAAWCGISFDPYYGNPLYYAGNLYLNGTLLTEAIIPNGVTTISVYAFSYCDSLMSVTIPDSVTSIGDEAFRSCTSLTSITIPESVTSIGKWAFSSCSSLTSVTIPDSVTSIGWGAFSDCSSLTSIIYCGTEEQWNKISIGAYNDPLLNAARTYHTHSWSTEPMVFPATCTAIGKKVYTCSCAMQKSESIPARGHNYSAEVTTEATCTEEGVRTYTCSRDAQHTYTEAIPALGHDMQIKQHLAPTKEATGVQVRICSRCELTKNTVLPKLGADLGDLNGDGAINSKDVTLMRRFLAGDYGVTFTNELIADTNKDGVVNAKDVTILRRFLAGGYGVVLD